MMKIVLSADNDCSIYLVPNYVAKELDKYIGDFLNWLYDENNKHEYWCGEGLCYDERAFIKWLNNKISKCNEKAKLVEIKEELNDEEKKYLNFNF